METVEKKIILFVGPKGTGKTYLGCLLQDMFGIPFLRIEGIWQELQQENNGLNSADYQKEGIRRCLNVIKKKLSENDSVIIETTGTFDDFPAYLESLKNFATVSLVNIQSRPENCASRVKTRDQTMHISVSDDQVEAINARSSILKLDWDLVLVNDPFLSKEEVKFAFTPLLT